MSYKYEMRDLLKSEVVTVGNGIDNIATLESLLADAAFEPGTTQLQIQNLSADDLYIWGGAAASVPDATTKMGVIPEESVQVFNCPRSSLKKLYVCGAAAHTIFVWQMGIKSSA